MNISSPYLDTIISLALIYALLSVLVSILLEIWNQHTKARGKTLQDSIFKLINDPLNHNFGYLIYQHPIINRMRKDENSYPAYISADNFCNALIDVLSAKSVQSSYELKDGQYVQTIVKPSTIEERLTMGVAGLNPSEFRDLIQNFIDRNTLNGVLNLKELKTEMGTWYDDYMDRIGGQYKNNNRPKMIGLGLLVAAVLNVDTIHLTKVLFLDQELRNRMVTEAQKVSADYENTEGNSEVKIDAALNGIKRQIDQIVNDSAKEKKNENLSKSFDSVLSILGKHQLDSANKMRKDLVFRAMSRWEIPIGYNRDDAPISWFRDKGSSLYDYKNTAQENVMIEYFESRNKFTIWRAFKWLIGIIISGIALGYGAPFWFETLGKLINIRSAGQKPQKMNTTK
ncbi:MAG TPA: hypothetical protein VGF79_08890 [Bacteroidia bacterium]